MGIIVDLARMRARARGGILPGPQVLNPASVNARARACVVVVRASPLKAALSQPFSQNALCAYYLPVLHDFIDDFTAVCSSCYSLFCL